MCLQRINICYVCGLCRIAYQRLPEFLNHKKEDHFDEFQKIKCIVFEEKPIYHKQDHSSAKSSGENKISSLTVTVSSSCQPASSVHSKSEHNSCISNNSDSTGFHAQEEVGVGITTTNTTAANISSDIMEYTNNDFQFDEEHAKLEDADVEVKIKEEEVEPHVQFEGVIRKEVVASPSKGELNPATALFSRLKSKQTLLPVPLPAPHLLHVAQTPKPRPKPKPEPEPSPILPKPTCSSNPRPRRPVRLPAKYLDPPPAPTAAESKTNIEIGLGKRSAKIKAVNLLKKQRLAAVAHNSDSSASEETTDTDDDEDHGGDTDTEIKIELVDENVDEEDPLAPTLRDWLIEQRSLEPSAGSTADDANIILLDPDPLTEDIGPINRSNPIRCKLCGKKFVEREELKYHVSNCWLNNKEKHRYCVICNKDFIGPSKLKRHSWACFATEEEKALMPKFKCEHCSKEFFSKHPLKVHLEKHKRREEQYRPHQCHVCGLAVRTQTYLRDHMRTHSDERPFVCTADPHCPLAFKTRTGLFNHLKIHSDQRPFVCPHESEGCSKAFKTKYELQLHVRGTHTGERPHKCPHDNCGKCFLLPAGLKYHLKAEHMDEAEAKTFKCSFCAKGFINQSTLKIHLVVHSEERPFPCPFPGCSVAFKHRKGVTKHQKMHMK